jgi:tetratricopeptide (TPR) repeat protein
MASASSAEIVGGRGRSPWAFRGCAVLLAGFAVLWALAAPSAAKEEEEEEDKRQYTIDDQRTGKRLLAAQEALQAGDFVVAREVLDGFNMGRLNPYEAALVWRMRAYADASEEKYEDAVESYEQCLAQDALPKAAQQGTRFDVAQIYMMLERWDDAIRMFEVWFEATESPSPLAYYMMAAAYYQAGKEEEAIEPARQAVELSDEPREPWLQLLLALYLDRKRYQESLPLVQQLVTRYPKKAYWIQLAAVYYALEEDENSLAVQQLAYKQGLLTNNLELRRLAQMYLFHDLPYRAARVLEQGLTEEHIESDRDAWQLLGNSWLSAREYDRALDPMARAASLAEDGELYLRLGQIHIQREEWNEATAAVRKALEKGLDEGPNTPCHGHLLIGVARYHQDNLGGARSSFVRALNCEKTQEMADRWIQYVEREIEQQEDLFEEG